MFASALGTRETSSSYRISVAPSSASAIKVLDNPFVSLSKSLDESEVDALLSVKIKNLNNLIVRINRVNKADVVKEAESWLLNEEWQCILERKRVKGDTWVEEQTLTSWEEGPSKGKEVDPCNWGRVDLKDADLDIEAKKEALSNWSARETGLRLSLGWLQIPMTSPQIRTTWVLVIRSRQ